MFHGKVAKAKAGKLLKWGCRPAAKPIPRTDQRLRSRPDRRRSRASGRIGQGGRRHGRLGSRSSPRSSRSGREGRGPVPGNRVTRGLDWLRRYEPTGREGRGPQLRQTSNAYRLSLPARALRLLGHLMQAPPLPDDIRHARELHASEIAAHRASLPLDELPLFEVEDDRLGRLLADLGRAVQERESARRSESQAKKNA